MKKKIALTVLLGLLLGITVYVIVHNILQLSFSIEQYRFFVEQDIIEIREMYSRSILNYIVYLLGNIGCVVLIVACLGCIWKKQVQTVKFSAIYTYEEFKKEREEKKELKKQVKLKKLENKIQKLK